MDYSLTQIIWYFLIYSFLGWCVEVVYCTVNKGVVVNRGFLNGPVCPIYGFGMVGVLLLLKAAGYQNVAQASLLLLFFGGMLLASSVEFLAGWALMKLFHARWWDYSMRPFNLGGYICLQFSIIWGLGAVLVIRIVQLPLSHIVESNLFSGFLGLIVEIGLCLLYFIDFVMTVFIVVGMNRHLEQLEELRQNMKDFSENLSEKIGTTALDTDQRIGEARVQAALAKAEFWDAAEEKSADLLWAAADKRNDFLEVAEDIKEDWLLAAEAKRKEYEAQLQRLSMRMDCHRVFGSRRLLQAFPTMCHNKHNEIVKQLKERCGLE